MSIWPKPQTLGEYEYEYTVFGLQLLTLAQTTSLAYAPDSCYSFPGHRCFRPAMILHAMIDCENTSVSLSYQ